jgi:hypothetical protein
MDGKKLQDVLNCIELLLHSLQERACSFATPTPHSFSSRVFLHYYKFYFFLFSTLYLVSSFL